jgi:hypothetical protein
MKTFWRFCFLVWLVAVCSNIWRALRPCRCKLKRSNDVRPVVNVHVSIEPTDDFYSKVAQYESWATWAALHRSA